MLNGILAVGEAESDVNIIVLSRVTEDGLVSLSSMGPGTFAYFGTFTGSGASIDGRIELMEGISSDVTVRFEAELTVTGTIDLNNNDIATTGSLLVYGGGGGTIENGGTVHGVVSLGEVGTPTSTYFTGTASFAGAASTASIFINDVDEDNDGDGDSVVDFSGTFQGSICGKIDDLSWPTTEPIEVPGNIRIAAMGTSAKVCGVTACGSANFADDGTGLNKSRFISFIPNASETRTRAIAVRLDALHDVNPAYSGGSSNPCQDCPGATCEGCEGQIRYVQAPASYVESHATETPFKAAVLGCEPHYRDWSSVGLLHVTGSAIVPSSTYNVELLVGDNAACAGGLVVATTRWGDVASLFNPPSTTVQPDVGDISALVNKFRSAPGAPIKARALLAGAPGDPFGVIDADVLSVDLNFAHISACVDAFRGVPYPYKIAACP